MRRSTSSRFQKLRNHWAGAGISVQKLLEQSHKSLFPLSSPIATLLIVLALPITAFASGAKDFEYLALDNCAKPMWKTGVVGSAARPDETGRFVLNSGLLQLEGVISGLCGLHIQAIAETDVAMRRGEWNLTIADFASSIDSLERYRDSLLIAGMAAIAENCSAAPEYPYLAISNRWSIRQLDGNVRIEVWQSAGKITVADGRAVDALAAILLVHNGALCDSAGGPDA